MEFGADVAAMTASGCKTPVHLAAEQNDHEAIRLLGRGVREISDVDNKYALYTPLHKATRCGHLVAIRVLVKELGANVNAKSQGNHTLVYVATYNRDGRC